MLNDDRDQRRDSFDSGGNSGSARLAPVAEGRIFLEGTAGQIAWAGEIRERVNAEFDRVRASIEAGSNKFRALDRNETATLLALLEEHRATVLAAGKAEYFIAQWQNPPDRLMRVLSGDVRWKAISDARAARRPRAEATAPIRYLGFDDAAGTRIYKFGRLPSHDGMEIFVVSMAVAMFLKHKISFQDGPAMCSAIMAAHPEPKDHWVTDEDSMEFIARRPVKADRKAPRQKQALPAQ
ncbi:MAG: hypothetical protein ABSB15_02095 [Bryobacteraceae bacterium]|jgi:hypothetical protein